MIVDARAKFLDRAAVVIAADREAGVKDASHRFTGYSKQELRLAKLKSLRVN